MGGFDGREQVRSRVFFWFSPIQSDRIVGTDDVVVAAVVWLVAVRQILLHLEAAGDEGRHAECCVEDRLFRVLFEHLMRQVAPVGPETGTSRHVVLDHHPGIQM